jgi:RHS repeat-associated protein
MKYILAILIYCCILSGQAQAQFVSIMGNTQVEPGQQASYFASYSSTPSSSCWTVVNGEIISSGCGQSYANGTTFVCPPCHSITVRWSATATSGTITVRSGINSSVTNTRTVTIVQPLVVGAVHHLQRIPFGTSPGMLWPSTASGGDGTYMYRWQSSVDNMNWNDEGGPASSPWSLTFTPSALTSSMYYRLRVTSGMQAAVSNSMRIEVLAALDAGEIASSHFIRPGMQPSILKGTTAKGETGQFTYQWQQSGNGTVWNDVAGATGVDYQPPALNSTTWYRRRVTSVNLYNQAGQQLSNVAVVTVSNNATGKTPTLTADNSFTQPVKQLVDLPGVTAQHFNRMVSFTAKKPGVALMPNLLHQSVTDGNIAATYADGLDRTLQSISQRATVNSTDVVEAVQYDAFGRSPADFLPYTDGQNNAGVFRTDAGTQQRQFYQNQFPGEQFPYSYTIAEDEVEAGVLAQSAPGNAFAGRNISGRSTTRVYMESENVWRFIIHNGVPALPALAAQRMYGSRDLVVEETYDVNNRRLVRYTNLDGQMVMEKLQQNDPPAGTEPQWSVTYYLYDGMGKLQFVLPQTAIGQFSLIVPPGNAAVSVTLPVIILNEQCYIFSYDKFGRVETKKVAGVVAEKYIYDKLGRQVMSQDAKQAQSGHWSFIQFDAIGRPWKTAEVSGTASETVLRNAAALSNNYLPAGSFDWQTETFYDHYSFSEAAARPFNSVIMGQLTGGPNEVISNMATSMTRGLLTGTKVKVLYPAGVPQGPQWLIKIYYYDYNKRVIQTQVDNVLGGVDITGVRFNFSGQPVSQVLQHSNPKIAANHPSHIRNLQLRKRFEYYDNGVLRRLFQQVGNEPEQQLVQHEYNDLGQLQRKTLGNNLEQLNFNYNIQGQLTGINEGYLRNRNANHWWGGTFHFYDGFTGSVPDGSISGLTWRSRGRFDEAHAYGFSYDQQGRLKEANYTVNTAAAPGSTGWTQAKNYTVNDLQYDDAGNITKMRTQSTAWGETRTIDNLTYNYQTGTHKLNAVNDAATPQNRLLSDFRDSVQQAQEYIYDANGNLTEDKNKGFTALWNHLDKPSAISFIGNRHIKYVYDATGQRLQKWMDLNGTLTSTTYVGGIQYQNDTLLHHAVNESGRLRRNRHGRLVYDYYIDDHLGNTRMVLTAERDTFAYAATYERARNAEEEATWRNRNTARDTVLSNNLFFNQPANNHWASRLNGSEPARRIGAGVILRVMSGDTINLYTRAAYQQAHGAAYNNATPVADLVSSLVTAFIGTATGNLDNKSFLPTNGSQTLNTNGFTSLLTHQQSNTAINGTPRAFIKAILFDEQLQLVDSINIRINRGAGQVFEYSRQYNVPKNGFIYVYPMNESGVDVWFDDVSVTHRTGPLLQESSFYPFGMEIAPLSSYAAIKTPNERDFQKNELDEELGLNLHYFDARMYDASIGRFMGVDPKADQQMGLNPYHYAANNPAIFKDPDGKLFFAAALLVGKFLLKKALVKGIIKMTAAKLVKVKIAAAAVSNIVANRKQIAAATKGSGNFWKGLGMAVGYGAVGAIGGAVGISGTGTDAFVAGGAMNTLFEGFTGQFNKEGVNPYGRMLGSFITGGMSALSGKYFGSSLEKGSDMALKTYGFKAASGSGIFSGSQIGKYALAGIGNMGAKLNEYNGNLNIGQMGTFFGAGFASELVSYSIGKSLKDGLPNLFRENKGYGFTSFASPLLAKGTGDFVGNTINYIGAKGKFPEKLSSIYSDGFKSLFKLDFYTASSFWGFMATDIGFDGIFEKKK